MIVYEVTDSIAVIRIDNPPANTLSQELRVAWDKALDQVFTDEKVSAVITTGTGSIFCGGADIAEFRAGTFFDDPNQPDILLQRYYHADKPMIAAINGYALGGGLETALACDYRIACKDAQLGLPEVKLGIIPGAMGTQILPRIVGIEQAMEIITSGDPLDASKALEIGLIDEIIDNKNFLNGAVQYAKDLIKKNEPLSKSCLVTLDTSELAGDYFEKQKTLLQNREPHSIAKQKAADAIEVSCRLNFEEGIREERNLFLECMKNSEARSLQHIFFAERAVTKVSGVDKNTPIRSINKVGVIGAGTMGVGITICFLNANIPTAMLDINENSLDKAVETIRSTYLKMVDKGRLRSDDAEKRLGLLQCSTEYSVLDDVDLVIEATFEEMELKKTIFRELDAICKPGAMLATNTSTLDINEIAKMTGRPEDVIGLHFFSPANVMKLLEIVRAEKTSPEVIASCQKIAKVIGKVPVVAGVCWGFIANRVLEPYARESTRLLLEGATPVQIEMALQGFGMPMSFLRMIDLAGIDVGYHTRAGFPEAFRHDPSYQRICDELFHLGRFGQKTGRGIFKYDGREWFEDPEVLQLSKDLAKELKIIRRSISEQEILERTLFALINEGARILDEGIAYRSSDIDVVFVHGFGFPRWHGGPMQYADEIGLETVLSGVCHYRDSLGKHGCTWFEPAPLLEKLVKDGQTFNTWQA